MKRKKTVAAGVAALVLLAIVIALMVRSCGVAEQADTSSSELLPEQSAVASSAPSESTSAPQPSSTPSPSTVPAASDDSRQKREDNGTQETPTPQGNTGGGNPPTAPSTPATQPVQMPPATSTPAPAYTPPANPPAPPSSSPPAQSPAPDPEPVIPEPPQTRTICNTCGADITGNVPAHGDGHLLSGEDFSYRVE